MDSAGTSKGDSNVWVGAALDLTLKVIVESFYNQDAKSLKEEASIIL
jgi:hypothetical protein